MRRLGERTGYCTKHGANLPSVREKIGKTAPKRLTLKDARSTSGFPISLTSAFSQHMTGYDIIGDIHGHADALHRLLDTLGYETVDGVRRHPEGRRVVFLGDFIDRGPDIRGVLHTVRSMRQAGSAFAVMGNHELNALHYQTYDEATGKWLRSHSEGHLRQFRATLEQLTDDLDDWLAWMRTLPVWLKLTDEAGVTLRFAHAAWDEAGMRRLYESPTAEGRKRFEGPFEAPVLTEAGLYDFGRRRDPVTGKTPCGYKMKERILTGPETPLPDTMAYLDKEGTRRTHARVRWWQTPDAQTTLADMVMAGAGSRELLRQNGGDVPFLSLRRKKPFVATPVEGLTFVGHYWLDPSEVGPLTDRLACLDYSVARGGVLAAYRHRRGDTRLDPERFVVVPAQLQ